MNSSTRRTLSMAARALDFAEAHPSTDASCTALVTRLTERVARGKALDIQEQVGVVGERASQVQRKQVKETLARVQLRHLMDVGKLATKDHPELKGLFVAPKANAPQRKIVNAANGMLAAVLPHKDVLASVGLGDTFLAELEQAVTDFDAATDTAHSGRRDHVGANGELPEVAQDCRDIVRVLDGLYRIRFKSDPEALAAWKSSSNVTGPFTRSKQAPADQPAVAPGADRAPSPISASVSPSASEQSEPPKQLQPPTEAA